MRACTRFLFLLSSRTSLAVVQQGNVTSSESAGVRGFYSSLEYQDEFCKINIPDMSIELLPFQKEGVGWMSQREQNYTGGIMADHLGMGKTVQMIGLCLVSDKVNKMTKARHLRRRAAQAEGIRLLTIVRQMQKLSVIANCTRINQPATDLRSLITLLGDNPSSEHHTFKNARAEVHKWLDFAKKFHPIYVERAVSFLMDEHKRDFDLIESKELRTLVVVPASLMLQWKSEIETKVNPSRGLRVHLYHGEYKWISPLELESHDFVVTTYDTLTNAASSAFVPGDNKNSYTFNRSNAGAVFNVRWKRIILDEAHMIRHARTQRWLCVQQLEGVHRWAVTATPLHNSIEDIQNLLHFAGVPRLPVLPGCSSEELLNDPMLQRGIARSLQPAFLRRGPVMFYNGQRVVLVQLPPKTEMIVKQSFSLEESKMYNSILARSRSAIDASEHTHGPFHIFAMMTRLRQTCCHPWIADGKAVTVNVCSICNTEATTPVTTPCGHTFCQECLMLRFYEMSADDQLPVNALCPTCSCTVRVKSVFQRRAPTPQERLDRYRKHKFVSSTKVKMILEAYETMRRDFPDDKMIIFSQFTSFIDIITVAFEQQNIDSLRLDGTMSLDLRNRTIKHFQNNNSIHVLLASKTATGVGLNLVTANHVLVVDPWWNPAIEEQAVHRCYRIGQKKPVYVTRFIIADTIEHYCYEICQKKKEFGDAVLRAATSGSSSARVAASKLQELVSHLKFIDDADELSNTTSNRNDGASSSIVSSSPVTE